MRKIKFRGKNLKGEWVYGAYIPAEYTQTNFESIVTKHQRFEVIPGTIGECTGCLDAYGKEVYEGDILVHDDFQGVVMFGNGEWFIDGNTDAISISDVDICKVIGNIHDDRELMKC